MNYLQIIGNVGTELKKTVFENGQIGEFTVATNSFYKNRNGEKVQTTEWFNCRCRGKLVDFFENRLNVGEKIYLAGELKTETWEKDGQKHYKTVMNIDKFELLSNSSK